MKDNPDQPPLLSRLTDWLSVYAAGLFLLYMLIFAAAYPKPELLAAIAFEVTIFSVLAIWRWNHSKSTGEIAKRVVLEQVGSQLPVMARSYKLWQRLVVGGWILICLLMNVDLTALCLAYGGKLKSSEILYERLPLSLCLGMHPAASLETLAGAYVEAGKFGPAQKLYGEVRDIRLQIYGPKNDMIVALDTDFGDLYFKEKRYDLSAQSYLDAIALSKEIASQTGYGRPLTGLANVMRARGEFAEARKAYEEALDMRIKLYGSENWRVGQTLRDYAELLRQSGDIQAAEATEKHYQAIEAKEKEKQGGTPWLGLIICLISLPLSYFLFGPKGFLTRFATKRLKDSSGKREPKNAKANATDLKNLILLLKFQGEHKEAERYQEKLKELERVSSKG
ncbi:MAG: tetratricopeptide repeat protein [Cyanobacteria bacterium REEB67]|nr:tetratricopeptide repeat protein [Cyanobacteria bacterium REEB67]